MEKIADAIQQMIAAGGPLAAQGLAYWFWLRMFDSISSVLIAATVCGAMVWALRLVLMYFRWYFETDRAFTLARYKESR